MAIGSGTAVAKSQVEEVIEICEVSYCVLKLGRYGEYVAALSGIADPPAPSNSNSP